MHASIIIVIYYEFTINNIVQVKRTLTFEKSILFYNGLFLPLIKLTKNQRQLRQNGKIEKLSWTSMIRGKATQLPQHAN